MTQLISRKPSRPVTKGISLNACIVSGLYQSINSISTLSHDLHVNIVGSTCCSVISFNGMMKRVILDFMLPGYFAFVGKPFNEISGVVIKWA